ncbi:hypothetical protein FQA23_0010555, partial [Aptenodytes patagonicus]
AELERAIVNVSAELEKVSNAMLDSIIALQEEIKSLSQMVTQNSLALHYFIFRKNMQKR